MISCQECKEKTPAKRNSSLSFLSTLLIIIIPKCPFCVMAYSSAITVCGGHSMYMYKNNWVSFIPLGLAVLVILMLALNYKGRKTLMAISFAALGFALLILVHQLVISPAFYNLGAVMLFFSIWANGSLNSFLNTIALQFKKRVAQWRS